MCIVANCKIIMTGRAPKKRSGRNNKAPMSVYFVCIHVSRPSAAEEATPREMGNVVDKIPVISQAKSFVQVVAGDPKAAEKTQENFLKGVVGYLKLTAPFIPVDLVVDKVVSICYRYCTNRIILI